MVTPLPLGDEETKIGREARGERPWRPREALPPIDVSSGQSDEGWLTLTNPDFSLRGARDIG